MEADEETFPHNKATADMENKILAKKDIGGEWQCKKKNKPSDRRKTSDLRSLQKEKKHDTASPTMVTLKK